MNGCVIKKYLPLFFALKMKGGGGEQMCLVV